MKRIYLKIGDIFSAKIDEKHKKYFQYIANDLTQLNSDVIRAFKKTYLISDNPNPSEIINEDADLYAHCIVKLGVKMALWEKVGNSNEIGKLNNILFKGTSDYGVKFGEEPIRISNKWYVWHIGDNDFKTVGQLEGEYKNAYIGLVINPNGIMELLKGHKYPVNYPL